MSVSFSDFVIGAYTFLPTAIISLNFFSASLETRNTVSCFQSLFLGINPLHGPTFENALKGRRKKQINSFMNTP